MLGHPDAQTQIFIVMAQSLASKLKTSDPAKAEAVLTAALVVESDFPALLIDRASVRDRLNDTRGAAADRAQFTELTRFSLDDAKEACLSPRLHRMSRDVALDMCDKAITDNADDVALHMRRGFLLQTMNRKPDAVAAYRRATEIEPSNPRAKYGLGKLLRETGEAEEGEALMAEALRSDATVADEDEPMLEVRRAS